MNKSSAITAIKIFQLPVITHFYFLSQKDGLTHNVLQWSQIVNNEF